MRHRAVVVALGCLVLVCSCRGPNARPAVLSGFNAVGSVHLVDHNKGKVDPSTELAALRAAYDQATADPGRRKAIRDQVIGSMLLAIKNYHEATEDDVFEAASGLAVLFDLLGLGTNATGVALAGETGKTIANAVAGALIGTRSSLEKNVLAENTKTAILLMMQADRDAKEIIIRNNQKLPDRDYSLDAALPELFDFYTAGSLRTSVTALVAAGQKKASQAKQILNTVSTQTTHEQDASKLMVSP